MALQTIEDFETPDTRFFSGYYLTVSRTNASDYVQRGHYAGKLDYALPEDTGYYSQAMAGSFSNLETPYTALNLWVYGDGSGNQLSFLYTGDIKSGPESCPSPLLDFTGWKQINVHAAPGLHSERRGHLRSLHYGRHLGPYSGDLRRHPPQRHSLYRPNHRRLPRHGGQHPADGDSRTG